MREKISLGEKGYKVAFTEKISIRDFRLPHPFYEYQKWPQALPREEKWLLSLNFASSVGGFFKPWLEGLLATGQIIWSLDLTAFRSHEALRQEAIAWLNKTVNRTAKPFFIHIEKGGIFEMKRLFPSYETSEVFENAGEAPDAKAWLCELAPHSIQMMDENGLKLAELLASFQADLGVQIQQPWQELGFFPGFLRKLGHQRIAEKLFFEWSRAQVLYSPQDETNERKRLSDQEVILNPAHQLVRSELDGEKKAWILYRKGFEVRTYRIKPAEAVLIDELNEEGLLRRDTIFSMYHNNSEILSAFETLQKEDIILGR